MALVLACHLNSCNALAVRLILAQGGIAFDLREPASKLRGVTDPRLPMLRESGDKSSYRSAPALFGFLCDKYVQLSRFFPNKAPARAELSELLTKLQDKLVPAVRTAVENEDAGPVTAMLDELLPLLQGAGFLYGDTLTIADIYAVCALRPYMVMDNVLPHQFHDLADRVALAMTGWKTIVGPFDRIVLRGDPSGTEEVLPVGHAEAWEGDIGPSKPVQPEHLLALAKNLKVDVATEPRLLWLLHRALNMPLPPNWRRVQANAASFFSDFAQHGDSKASGMRSHGASRATMGASRATMGASRATMNAKSHVSMRAPSAAQLKARQSGLLRPASKRAGHASDVDIDSQTSKFLNPTTGEVTVVHPGASFLEKQVADARRFAAIMGSDLGLGSLPGSGAWMKFTSLPPKKQQQEASGRRFSAASSSSYGQLSTRSGAGGAGAGAGPASDGGDSEKEDEAPPEFWYNFDDGQRAEELPVGARLIPYPPSPSTDQAAVLATAGTAGSLQSTIASRQGLGMSPPGTRGRTLTPVLGGRPDLSTPMSLQFADTARPARTRKPRSVHELDTLHFKSWWKEGNATPQASSEKRDVNTSAFRRQTVDVFFTIEDGSFKIALDGDDKVYSISHIEGRNGPLECWDLYVGARINMLGRNITLKQATLATQQWIDHHAVRLEKLIKRMTKELVKYDVDASHQLSKKRQQAVTKGGKTHLRAKVDFLDTLRRKLAFYRPKLAQNILEGLLTGKA